MIDLAAALSPATPSQLIRSVSAAGGCEGCSLPLLRWVMVPLSETLRLDNKEGLEEAVRESSSVFTERTSGGRDLPARRCCIPITKPSNQAPCFSELLPCFYAMAQKHPK